MGVHTHDRLFTEELKMGGTPIFLGTWEGERKAKPRVCLFYGCTTVIGGGAIVGIFTHPNRGGGDVNNSDWKYRPTIWLSITIVTCRRQVVLSQPARGNRRAGNCEGCEFSGGRNFPASLSVSERACVRYDCMLHGRGGAGGACNEWHRTGAPTYQLALGSRPDSAGHRRMAKTQEHTTTDNYNLKSHEYVCITTYQPDNTCKSNPNPNPNPSLNPTTKQHAIVNIQLNVVIRPTYQDNFKRDSVVPFVLFSIVIVTLPVVARK